MAACAVEVQSSCGKGSHDPHVRRVARPVRSKPSADAGMVRPADQTAAKRGWSPPSVMNVTSHSQSRYVLVQVVLVLLPLGKAVYVLFSPSDSFNTRTYPTFGKRLSAPATCYRMWNRTCTRECRGVCCSRVDKQERRYFEMLPTFC